MDIKYVVFSSGAMGGLSLIGSWRALEERNITHNIKGLSGCSIGSVIATLVSIGYTSKELEDIATLFQYEDYSDLHFRMLSDNFGIETGHKIIKLLQKIIKHKTGNKYLTFADHWKLTGRQLWINAGHLEEHKSKYYSVFTSPNMTITDAIRQSISIPFLFTAIKTDIGTFIDGGCYDPVPANMFPPKYTLCFNIRNNKIDNTTSPDNLLSYSTSLLGSVFNQLNNYRFEKQEKAGWRIIYIDTGLKSFTLQLDKKELIHTINLGYISTINHIEKI